MNDESVSHYKITNARLYNKKLHKLTLAPQVSWSVVSVRYHGTFMKLQRNTMVRNFQLIHDLPLLN